MLNLVQKIQEAVNIFENHTYEVWADVGGAKYFEYLEGTYSAPTARDALEAHLEKKGFEGAYHLAAVRKGEDPNVPENVLAWRAQ